MAETETAGAAPAPLVSSAPLAPAAPAPGSPASPAASDWRATLPEDLKANPALEKFKDPAAVARSYVELEKFRGRAVVPPGPDAKPEEVDAFYRKVGKPERADAYVIPLPEGATPDPAVTADFQQAVHRLNLTQAQVAGLVDWYRGSPMGNPAMAHDALQRESVTALKGEWGGAYDYNIALAARTAKQIGGPEVLQLLEVSGLGNHPAMVKMFNRLGKDYAESGEILVDSSSGGVIGPQAAQARILEITSDRSHPYHRRGPGHDEAVQEMFRLHQIASEGT